MLPSLSLVPGPTWSKERTHVNCLLSATPQYKKNKKTVSQSTPQMWANQASWWVPIIASRQLLHWGHGDRYMSQDNHIFLGNQELTAVTPHGAPQGEAGQNTGFLWRAQASLSQQGPGQPWQSAGTDNSSFGKMGLGSRPVLHLGCERRGR